METAGENQKQDLTQIRKAIFTGLITGTLSTLDDEAASWLAMGHTAWQLVICDRCSFDSLDIKADLSSIMKLLEPADDSSFFVVFEGKTIILLNGQHAIRRFSHLLDHYNGAIKPEHNSYLDSLFFAFGRVVYDPRDIILSLNDAREILGQRFFHPAPIHVMTHEQAQKIPQGGAKDSISARDDILARFIKSFVSQIQLFNRNKLSESLRLLGDELRSSSLSETEIRLLLIDMYMGIKEQFMILYNTTSIPFPPSSLATRRIMESRQLHEILGFLSESSDIIMSSIGYSSRDSIIDDVIYYVEHNYTQSLTLENIAPIFGYNSSYLGKIFRKRTGKRLNTFLDEVRIDRAKDILRDSRIQVYKVAEMVGYRNVDYFHVKFKKYTGQSPMEFRRENSDI